ncbi:MAG: hypothetical protein ABEJ86_07765 [Halococcoides sp.]
MRPIAAYRRGLGALRRSPALVGVIAAVGIVNAVLGYVPMGIMAALENPLIGNVVSMTLWPVFLFVGPAIMGGLFGMAWEALDGRADLGDFLSEARSNYLQLLGWGILFVGVVIALTIVTMILMWIVMIVLIIGMMGASSASGTGGAMAGIGLIILVVFALLAIVTMVVMLLPYALFQFIPGAIVFEDHDFIDAGKRGWRLLSQNLLPTLGFDLTVFALGLVVTAIAMGAMIVTIDFGAMFPAKMATAGSSQTINPYASLGIVEIGGLMGLSAVTSTISGLLVIPAYAAFFRIIATT